MLPKRIVEVLCNSLIPRPPCPTFVACIASDKCWGERPGNKASCTYICYKTLLSLFHPLTFLTNLCMGTLCSGGFSRTSRSSHIGMYSHAYSYCVFRPPFVYWISDLSIDWCPNDNPIYFFAFPITTASQ